MVTKIETINGKMVIRSEFEKFRKELLRYAETHKVLSVSTAIGKHYGRSKYNSCYDSK